MNVASLELCKELYSLSEWGIPDLTTYQYARRTESADWELVLSEPGKSWPTGYYNSFPAYDLGYLLRKLPPEAIVKYDLTDGWVCFGRFKEHTVCRADTPEDAAAKLAIELFKQGVLTRTEGH